VYAFDVDETLEVSKGPVKLADLVTLREHGHIAPEVWRAEVWSRLPIGSSGQLLPVGCLLVAHKYEN
jgi:hypothetical protein